MPVASWFEDMNDTELNDLIPFFEKLSKVDNVYSVLRNANHTPNTTIHQLTNSPGQLSNSPGQMLNSSSPIASCPMPNQFQNGTTTPSS